MSALPETVMVRLADRQDKLAEKMVPSPGLMVMAGGRRAKLRATGERTSVVEDWPQGGNARIVPNRDVFVADDCEWVRGNGDNSLFSFQGQNREGYATTPQSERERREAASRRETHLDLGVCGCDPEPGEEACMRRAPLGLVVHPGNHSKYLKCQRFKREEDARHEREREAAAARRQAQGEAAAVRRQAAPPAAQASARLPKSTVPLPTQGLGAGPAATAPPEGALVVTDSRGGTAGRVRVLSPEARRRISEGAKAMQARRAAARAAAGPQVAGEQGVGSGTHVEPGAPDIGGAAVSGSATTPPPPAALTMAQARQRAGRTRPADCLQHCRPHRGDRYHAPGCPNRDPELDKYDRTAPPTPGCAACESKLGVRHAVGCPHRRGPLSDAERAQLAQGTLPTVNPTVTGDGERATAGAKLPTRPVPVEPRIALHLSERLEAVVDRLEGELLSARAKVAELDARLLVVVAERDLLVEQLAASEQLRAGVDRVIERIQRDLAEGAGQPKPTSHQPDPRAGRRRLTRKRSRE